MEKTPDTEASTSMVERVAEAIRFSVYESEAVADHMHERAAIRAARAAIAAMREPTEAQYEALSGAGLMWRDMNSKFVWQTYVDAALVEEKG